MDNFKLGIRQIGFIKLPADHILIPNQEESLDLTEFTEGACGTCNGHAWGMIPTHGVEGDFHGQKSRPGKAARMLRFLKNPNRPT